MLLQNLFSMMAHDVKTIQEGILLLYLSKQKFEKINHPSDFLDPQEQINSDHIEWLQTMAQALQVQGPGRRKLNG